MAEAVAQFHRALDQLALPPDTPEHQRRELEFRSALGAALLSVKGQAAPERVKHMPVRASCGNSSGHPRSS